jgi:hypothetical protein
MVKNMRQNSIIIIIYINPLIVIISLGVPLVYRDVWQFGEVRYHLKEEATEL